MSGPGRLRGFLGLALLLGLRGPAVADTPESLSLADYRGRLAVIAKDLAQGDPAAARVAAGALLGERIAFGAESLAPDRSVLGPLARGVKGVELRRAAVRLSLLLASLPAVDAAAASSGSAGRGDANLLARLTARQALPALPRGGALPEIADSGPLRTVGDFFEPLRRWVAERWERLLDWLKKAFTRKREKGGSEVDLPRLVTVLVIVLAAVLAGLGLLALRRRRAVAAVPEGVTAPSPPARDDDPLSRRAGEWEAYAQELAAAARFREAVRAWYHAVLVALYQRGILHHRKGRTNWEYVAAVPPEAAWRPVFVAVTRRFEREWYGSDRSSREALEATAEEARALLGALFPGQGPGEPGA